MGNDAQSLPALPIRPFPGGSLGRRGFVRDAWWVVQRSAKQCSFRRARRHRSGRPFAVYWFSSCDRKELSRTSMASAITSFFQKHLIKGADEVDEHIKMRRARLAAAALLVEVVHSDGEITPHERRTLLAGVR